MLLGCPYNGSRKAVDTLGQANLGWGDHTRGSLAEDHTASRIPIFEQSEHRSAKGDDTTGSNVLWVS